MSPIDNKLLYLILQLIFQIFLFLYAAFCHAWCASTKRGHINYSNWEKDHKKNLNHFGCGFAQLLAGRKKERCGHGAPSSNPVILPITVQCIQHVYNFKNKNNTHQKTYKKDLNRKICWLVEGICYEVKPPPLVF